MPNNIHPSSLDFTFNPKRIALAARDITNWSQNSPTDCEHQHGFAPHLKRIALAADQHQCDTLVYALWSYDPHRDGPLTRELLFGESPTHLETVILEIMDASKATQKGHNTPYSKIKYERSHIEVWHKDFDSPRRFQQCFATSSDRVPQKRKFITDLNLRSFGSTLYLACGEINIICTQRNSNATTDEYNFLSTSEYANSSVIINPSHDYMSRHEIAEKRRRLSRNGRLVVSVWNRGHRKPEAREPWQVFFDGKRCSTVDSTTIIAEPGSSWSMLVVDVE